MSKDITIICPKCEGNSINIVVNYNPKAKKLECVCRCGKEWAHQLYIEKALDPPSVFCQIEEGTGLILVDVRRPNDGSLPRTGIRIKLPESRLVPLQEGAIAPSIVLGEEDE